MLCIQVEYKDVLMSLYYLSFQRGPPTEACAGASISISPTVLNDLREELYHPQSGEEVRINIAWLADDGSFGNVTSKETVITWQGSQTSYKQIDLTVPLKTGLYRLEMWANTANKAACRSPSLSSKNRHIIDIEALDLFNSRRTILLPVLSDAIAILKASDTQVALRKSTNIARLFRTSQSCNIIIHEEAGFELDKHLWDASILLTSYIEKECQKGKDDALSTLAELKGKILRVVELGAGTGLVSIGLACVLASLNHEEESNLQVNITATDLEPALELLQCNIDANCARWKGKGITVDCQSLDWSEVPMIVDADLILVSDCTYNPTYFKPLCNAIKHLLHQGKPTCSCLLSKKHRHVDEEALWSEMALSGLECILLAGQQAVEEGHWGIWRITL